MKFNPFKTNVEVGDFKGICFCVWAVHRRQGSFWVDNVLVPFEQTDFHLGETTRRILSLKTIGEIFGSILPLCCKSLKNVSFNVGVKYGVGWHCQKRLLLGDCTHNALRAQFSETGVPAVDDEDILFTVNSYVAPKRKVE